MKKILFLCFLSLPLLSYTQDKESEKKFKLGGWAQIQADGNFTEGEMTDMGFRIRRARMVVSGDLHPKISYKMQGDFSGSPLLLDAWLKWKLSDAFSVQLGQFKFPFSMESKITPMDLEYTDYGEAIQKLSGYKDICGVGKNGRDIGLMFSGKLLLLNSVKEVDRKHYLIGYSLGVFNGNGINITDANLQKDLVCKVDLYPFPFLPDWIFSASMYKGVFKNDEHGNYLRERYAVGLGYDNRKLVLRFEYLWGITSLDAPDENLYCQPTDANGGYAQLGYWFDFKCYNWQQRLMPYLRYDFFSNDQAGMIDKSYISSVYSLGFRYNMTSSLHSKVAYSLKEKKNKGEGKPYTHSFQLMLCYGF